MPLVSAHHEHKDMVIILAPLRAQPSRV